MVRVCMECNFTVIRGPTFDAHQGQDMWCGLCDGYREYRCWSVDLRVQLLECGSEVTAAGVWI